MEITNISGPDVVPAGFSVEPPRPEPQAEPRPVYENADTADNSKGTRVDVYA